MSVSYYNDFKIHHKIIVDELLIKNYSKRYYFCQNITFTYRQYPGYIKLGEFIKTINYLNPIIEKFNQSNWDRNYTWLFIFLFQDFLPLLSVMKQPRFSINF